MIRSIETGAIMDSEERLTDVADPQSAARFGSMAQDQARRIIDRLEKLAADALAEELTSKGLETKDATGAGGGRRFSIYLRGSFATAWQRFRRWIGTIANMNTQGVAEETAHAGRTGGLPPFLTEGQVVLVWRSLLDGKERTTHHAAHGQRVTLPGGVFTVGGASLRFPGDSGLGAPLKETINCFPGDTRVIGEVRGATRHRYKGLLVKITLASGKQLTGTPNHPVLTPEGWVGLGALVEGGNVMSRVDADDRRRFNGGLSGVPVQGAFDVKDIETKIAQVFYALSVAPTGMRVAAGDVNFHGDQPTEDVDIVSVNRSLVLTRNPQSLKERDQLRFARALLDESASFVDSLPMQLDGTSDLTPAGHVSAGSQAASIADAEALHPQRVGLAPVPYLYAGSEQPFPDGVPVGVEGFGQGKLGFSSYIAPDEIVDIDVRTSVLCHVYNLETVHGLYHANGVVVHNCRCYLDTVWIRPDGKEELIESGRLNPSHPTRRPRPTGANPNAFTRTRPTPAFTFGFGKGPWRGAIILGNGQRANYTVRNGAVTIRVGGKPVASAPITRDGTGNWQLGRVTTTEGYENVGIEAMLQNSVAASNRLPKR